MLNLDKHTKTKPKPKPPTLNFKNCSHVCAIVYNCRTQQPRTIPIIFPPILQTIIIAQRERKVEKEWRGHGKRKGRGMGWEKGGEERKGQGTEEEDMTGEGRG